MTRRLIPLCLASFLILTGCEGNDHDDGNTPATASLTGVAWRLSAWSVSSLKPTDFTITATFDGHRVSGTSAVNSYGGPYTASAGGDFSVGDLQSTLMAGPDNAMRAESIYLDLLGKARRYSIAGTTLTLSDKAGNALLIFTAPGQGKQALTRADNGKTVTVAKGESLTVVLAGNPTTGYQWELPQTNSALPLVETSYKSDSKLIGAGGTYTFRFTARETGDIPLRLVYKRSWEAEIAETFTATIQIR